MYYLKASVKSEAHDLISNIQLSDQNFSVAWKILNDRFSNQRAAATAHFNEIFKLESLRRESASSLLHLRNVVQRSLSALQNLGCPVQHYSAILIHMLSEKLDPKTQRDWEISIESTSVIPAYEVFDNFLLNRIRVLDSISPPESSTKFSHAQPKFTSAHCSKQIHTNACVVSQPQLKCAYCLKSHKIYVCPEFKGKSVTDRYASVQLKGLCSNCLSKGHKKQSCSSTVKCRECNQKHHTLLHRESAATPTPNLQSQLSGHSPLGEHNSSPVQTHFSISDNIKPNQIVLPTIRVWVSLTTNRKIQVRALLDQGSTWSFIPNKIAVALGAQRIRVSATMSGLGGAVSGTSSGAININISSKNGEFSVATQVLILPKITTYLPNSSINLESW